MNNPSVIITGSSGFIGSELVKHFAARHYEVVALDKVKPRELLSDVNYYEHDLNDALMQEGIFVNADYLIHCAYLPYSDAHKNADEININGTKRLVELAQKYNIKKIIFLSSFSAHEDAISHYGKTKSALEKLFNVSKDLILKPGLVLGNGGLYYAMREIISKNKYIPMPGGGNQPVQTIYVKQLAAIIQIGIEENISGIFAIAEDSAITMKMLYKAIDEYSGKNAIFVPLPYSGAEMIIYFSEIFHLKMPVTRESILGLKQNRAYDVSEAMKIFNMQFMTYKESLEQIKNNNL